MDASLREAITWTLGTIVTVCIIIGLAVRFVLMPYLREHLIAPVKQVEKQVSENNHANDEPTVLDRIDDVRGQVADVHTEVAAIARVLDGHMEWSERWTALIEGELDLLRRRDGDQS